MDWSLAIEKNRVALKGILALLIAMVEVAGVGSPAGAPATLPRHLHRSVLRLLRPAEAAARRLIIIAARGLVVRLSPPRMRAAKPKPALTRRNGFGTGIVLRPGPLPEWARALAPKRSSALSFPLFDPLKRWGVRRSYVKPSALPRVRFLDDPRIGLFHQTRQPEPLPPTPDDPLDSRSLHRRLGAIAAALDDLPRQAKRLARWQARRDAAQNGSSDGAAGAHERESRAPREGRVQRFSPMRPGRPPGWRRRSTHKVYEVLNELHGLAAWAQDRRDTS